MIMNKTFEGAEQEDAKANSRLNMISSEVERRAPRIFFYATEGIGKSSWAASAQGCGERPIFIPTEDGVRQIKCPKFPVAQTHQEVEANIDTLINEKHDFTMAVIDTIDWLERLIYNHICTKNNITSIKELSYGTGYTASMPIWESFIKKFDQLIDKGIAVVLLAHSCINKVEEPDGATYDHFAPKLHVNGKGKGIMKTFTEWADCLLFGNYEKFTTKDNEGFNRERVRVTGIGERMIYTTKQAAFNAKNRFSLPPQIPMGPKVQPGAMGYSDFGIFWNEFCNSPVFK